MTALGAKIGIARAVGRVARASGRGGGTSLPGKVLLRLEPDAIGELADRLPHGSAVISATNGKTTTATITATILEHAGSTLVHNRAGANMAGGIASTLLCRRALAAGHRRRYRPFRGRRVLARHGHATRCKPRALLLSNLFRDQLDRYGELETIADRWAQVVAGLPDSSALVLNADDPLIADLGRGARKRQLLRRRRRHAGAARDAACVGFQALPPVRRGIPVRRRLSRAPRPLPLRGVRPGAPSADGPGGADHAAWHQRGHVHARNSAG